MSANENTAPATAPQVPNLRDAKREMTAAKRRHPAGNAAPAKDAPAKAPAKKAPEPKAAERRTPTQSEKPKLRWDGEIAKAGDVEFAKLVEQKDGAYDAVVKTNGKTEILATGVSRNRAYAVIVGFYHRGERPVAKTVSATPKKAS